MASGIRSATLVALLVSAEDAISETLGPPASLLVTALVPQAAGIRLVHPEAPVSRTRTWATPLLADRPSPDRVPGLDQIAPLADRASTRSPAPMEGSVLATEDFPAAGVGTGTASGPSTVRASVGVVAFLEEALAGAVGVLASDGPIGEPVGRSAGILTGTTRTCTRHTRTRHTRTIQITVTAHTTVHRHTTRMLRTTTTRRLVI